MPHEPSMVELLVSIHVLLVPLWVLLALALYATLDWCFGREAAAAWTGRRRVSLLAWAFGLGVAVTTTAVALSAPQRFVRSLFDFNPAYAVPPFFVGLPEAEAGSFVEHAVVCALLELVVALPVLMATKLYEKWGCGRLTAAEDRPGLPGVAAWLNWPNRLWAAVWVVCVTAFVASVSQQDTNATASVFVVSTLASLAALAAYPISRSLRDSNDAAVRSTPQEVPPGGPDLSPERQRVLRLLEDGKITADEASDLLAALAATNAAPPAPAWPAGAFDGPHKLLLIGAAVLLVGFFLPWFRVAPAEELQRFGTAMAGGLLHPELPAIPPAVRPGDWVISIFGGDVGHGLGWLVLACGLATAALPAVSGLSAVARRQTAWLTLVVGTLVTLYLLSSGLRYASFGLGLALVAAAVQWFGLLLGVPHRALRPVAAVAA